MRLKSRIIVGICLAITMSTFTGCAGKGQEIKESEAKEIALKEAGLDEADVTFTKVSLDSDDGKKEYELEFHDGSTQYEYTIRAESGKVIDYSSEALPAGTDNTVKQDSATQEDSTAAISEEDAKQAVLAKLPGASKENIRMNLETDDGVKVYDGEIRHENKKYDFKVHASTGEIISWEEDAVLD